MNKSRRSNPGSNTARYGEESTSNTTSKTPNKHVLSKSDKSADSINTDSQTDENDFVTGDDKIIKNLYTDWLSGLQISELRFTALAVSNPPLKRIPNDKDTLIKYCLKELEKHDHKDTTVSRIKEYLDNSMPSRDSFYWIDEPMQKRQEAFLRRYHPGDWLESDKISTKDLFLLTYCSRDFFHSGFTCRDELRMLENNWNNLKILNELSWLKPFETKKFLTYFSKRFYEVTTSELTCSLSDENTSDPRKVYIPHDKLPELKTLEDALIWLDFFSNKSNERKEFCNKIRQGWSQYKYREGASKTQKNFLLQKSVADQLKQLSEEHGYSEVDIVTMLIKVEHKNKTSIKEFMDDAKAVAAHLKSG